MPHNNCVIVFDQNEHGTYFTGQVASGRVIITFNKPKKLKGILLQICGYAACQWKDKHGKKVHTNHNSKKNKKHVYYGREDYIASSTFLVGSERGDNFSIDMGTHTYTFSCPIPINAPSSYEGCFGHIRYMAKVTFIRSGCSNRTHNVGFTVLKLLDLNKETHLLKEPASNEALENFCLFQSKAIHLNVSLLQTGYVPGQYILVNANVQNNCQVDCKKVIIALNLRATYTSDTPCMRTTSEKICLVKKYCAPVPHCSQRNFAETIRVPPTPPTCEHLCKVVRVSYEVCVVAVMNHLMRNPKAIIPITIGNVPLASSYHMPIADDVPTTSSCAMQLASGRQHNLLSERTESDLMVDSIEDFEIIDDEEDEDEGPAELPPPTYEEAMFMTTDIADTDTNTVSDTARFTPRYPVYDVDGMMAASGISPPPNKPEKKRKRRKRRQKPQMEQTQEEVQVSDSMEKEKPPRESPIEI